MASKITTTTKFGMEKFDTKSNFFPWKMRVTSLLMKEGTHKALCGIEKKSSKMGDEEWNNIDFYGKATIIFCLSDEVLYNIINEKTTVQPLNRERYDYSTTSKYFQ